MTVGLPVYHRSFDDQRGGDSRCVEAISGSMTNVIIERVVMGVVVIEVDCVSH